MSSNPLSVLYPATRGMDMRTDTATFTPSQAGRFVKWTRNMRIEKGYFRTRYPFREIALDKPDGFDDLTWQGGILYHPHKGSGVHYQGRGKDRIVAAYGGKLFNIDVRNGKVEQIPGDDASDSPHRVPVFLEQAENYVIRTDGVNRTIIHDGSGQAFSSPGYNKALPDASRVPNNAGPVRYIGNRLWVSTYGRRLLAGDHLHRTDGEEAIDVIKFEDQTYDFTSQWFAPEAKQGDTVAIARMKLGARDFVVMHGNNLGMTGIVLNIPRAQWPDTPMKLVISDETAASGPYSYAEGDFRLIFRSHRGIEETKFVLAEDNTVGGTSYDLGKQVSKLLNADIESLLVYSTLVNPRLWDKTLVTAYPQIKGNRATHRGVLSMNRNPGDAIEPGQWAWEGAWTLPPQLGQFQQILEGRIDREQKVYFLVDKPDGNGLAEMQEYDGCDRLADGTEIRQNGAFQTHKLSLESEYTDGSWDQAAVLVRDVLTDCEMEIYVRDSVDPEWKIAHHVTICDSDCGDCSKCCNSAEMGDCNIPLGSLREINDKATWVQFHIETWGVASWDFAIQTGASGSLEETRSGGTNRVRKTCSNKNFGVYDYQVK